MQTVALVIVLAAGAWMAGVGVLMALRPAYCLHLMALMKARLEANSWRLTLTEQGLRILAGAALIVRAPEAKLPLVFAVMGWMLVVSSTLIIAAPMRWHAAYGALLLRHVKPVAVRLLSPVPAFVGAMLIWAAM